LRANELKGVWDFAVTADFVEGPDFRGFVIGEAGAWLISF
jgi:hypothetical protein